MISPHPSYPPLEMAEAGVLTITNKYGSKDLSQRFPEIISIDRVDPQLLADAIGAAVRAAEQQRIGKIIPRRQPRDITSNEERLYSPYRVAETLRAEMHSRGTTCGSHQ
jgi:hypothetical protein